MGYKTVVVGADGSESSLRAVDRAVTIVTEMGALLVVVCAYDALSAREAAILDNPIGNPRFSQVRGIVAAEAVLATVTRHAEQAGASGVAGVLVEGDAAEALLGVATERSADVIVVGNRGINTLSGRLLGSVPTDVVQRAPCDVLVVHTVDTMRK